MNTVKMEIVFPKSFNEADINNAILDIEKCLNDHHAENLVPTIKIENSLFSDILIWAKQKGILDKGDAKTQTVKLMEETGELAHGILKQDVAEVKDAIGDMVVVLTSIAYFHGLTVPECIQSAYDVISKRTGNMIYGNFVKHY